VGMGDVQVAGAQLYEAPTTGTNRPTLGDLARLSERQEAAYWDIQADVNRHRGGWVGGAIDGLRDSREGIDAAAQYARDHSPEALAGYVKANEWSPLADKAVASIQAPQGQVGGRSTGWRGSLTYDQMNNGLGAAGAAGFAGEQLLALPYFEGAWGASRSGQVLRGLGTVGALGGALVDLNAVANYNSNGPGPNALSPERAQTNLVFGAIGVVVPEVGVAYTLLDGLYPKGRYESGFEHFTVDWKAAVEQSQQARESALTGLPQEALWLQGRRR